MGLVVMPGRDGRRAHGIVLERIPFDPVAWDAMVATHADAEVYHSSAWLEFLAASQGAEAVVAVVRADVDCLLSIQRRASESPTRSSG